MELRKNYEVPYENPITIYKLARKYYYNIDLK